MLLVARFGALRAEPAWTGSYAHSGCLRLRPAGGAPQVAASMGATRQGAQKQLNLLVQGGLIETRDNPQHKRSPLYVLTKQGQRTYAAIDTHWSDHAAQIAAGFSSIELANTAKVLSELVGIYARSEARNET